MRKQFVIVSSVLILITIALGIFISEIGRAHV